MVSDKAGGLALEAAATKTVSQLPEEAGGRALSREEFDELFGAVPRDGDR